jgi:D-serine deaminase-like pyridoxal phosphate-dependent protein
LPVPLARLSTGGSSLEPLKGGVTVTQLNDQHAYLQLDSAETLDVGDRLVCGIVHPCSAFDRWREILLVNDAYRIEETIQTRFS